MHKNYYLFKALTIWLNSEIKNFTILECFTFQKSELVLRVMGEEELFLHISINPSNPYLTISESRNIKESKVNLFNELTNQKIIEIRINDTDKIISIITELNVLKSVFFGRTPNIFLYNSNNTEIARFKKANSESAKIDSSEKLLAATLESNQIKELIKSNKNVSIIKLLSRNIIGFNYVISRECCFRSSIDFDKEVSTLSEIQLEKLCENIKSINSEFENPNPIIYFDNEIPKYLVIAKMQHLENDFQSKTFHSVNDACQKFIWQSQKSKTFDKIVRQCESALNNRINFIKKTIDKIEEFEKLE